MYTFLLSCALFYYMYEKTFRLQKRIDILEYEMTNLTNVLFISTEYKKSTEYIQYELPSAPYIEF